MKNKLFHYFVEGECEKKLIDELKNAKNHQLVAGKVDVLNVITEVIPNARLLALSKNTTIVLVYDTDQNKTEILETNIKRLKQYGFKNVLHIQSIKNFEDEIVYSTEIDNINEVFNIQGTSNFKKKFISHNDLSNKLKSINFNHLRLWSRTNAEKPFSKYSNKQDLETIKIIKK